MPCSERIGFSGRSEWFHTEQTITATQIDSSPSRSGFCRLRDTMRHYMQLRMRINISLLQLAALARAESSDDADFLFRLGLMEGHLIVGRDLVQADRPKPALPHFGHPVRELYDDIKDYLAAKKLPPFDTQLIALEAQVTKAPKSPATAAKFDQVIAAIHRARDATPAEVRASVPAMIGICADTLEAAAGEYGQSIEKGKIESLVEYHDSRGFVSYLDQELGRLDAQANGESDRGLIARFKAVVAKAQVIVAPLLPPDRPIKPVSEYRAIAAEARHLAKR